MREKKCGIYKIVNTANKKLYIGSSSNICVRWVAHKSQLRHNKHPNKYLQHVYNKYGEEAFVFTVIEQVPKYELLDREQYWFNKTKCCIKEYGYNIQTKPGGGPAAKHIKCKIKGCGRPHAARGYCDMHYQRFMAHGTASIKIISPRMCKIKGCGRSHASRGYCEMHYQRFMRHGTASISGLKHQPPTHDRGCKVKECKNKHDSHGYCGKHMMYIRNYGKIQEPKIIFDPDRGCKIDGCNGKHASHGLCHKHYNGWLYRQKHPPKRERTKDMQY